MTTRDITTICGVVMRLAGIPLIIWGPTKETFYIGIALLMSGEAGPLGRALLKPGAATEDDIKRLQRTKVSKPKKSTPRRR